MSEDPFYAHQRGTVIYQNIQQEEETYYSDEQESNKVGQQTHQQRSDLGTTGGVILSAPPAARTGNTAASSSSTDSENHRNTSGVSCDVASFVVDAALNNAAAPPPPIPKLPSEGNSGGVNTNVLRVVTTGPPAAAKTNKDTPPLPRRQSGNDTTATTTASTAGPPISTPMPAAIAAFANLPMPDASQGLPPLQICEGDLVVYEYIAKRARATADIIDQSLASIRAYQVMYHQQQQQNGSTQGQSPQPGTISADQLMESQQQEQLPPLHQQPEAAQQQAQQQRTLKLPVQFHQEMQQPVLQQQQTHQLHQQVQMSQASQQPPAQQEQGLQAQLQQALYQQAQIQKAQQQHFQQRQARRQQQQQQAQQQMHHKQALLQRARLQQVQQQTAQQVHQGQIQQVQTLPNATQAVPLALPPPPTLRTVQGPSSAIRQEQNSEQCSSLRVSQETASEDLRDLEDVARAMASRFRRESQDSANNKSLTTSSVASSSSQAEPDYLGQLKEAKSNAQKGKKMRARTKIVRTSIEGIQDLVVPRDMHDVVKRNGKEHLLALTWEDVIAGSFCVGENDIGVCLDAVTVSLAQFEPCSLSASDRIGRYKHQELGYAGLCCKYCFGQPGYGRYFPSTLPSFASSFPTTAVKHVSEDCLGCPKQIKDLVAELDERHVRTMNRQSTHNGLRSFMDNIWRKLRSVKVDDADSRFKAKRQKVLHAPVDPSASRDTTWSYMLQGSKIVQIEDYCLVPDTLFAGFAQMTRCAATVDDLRRHPRSKNQIHVGQVGVCCKFCHGKQGAPGSRIFPSGEGALAQLELGHKVINHVSIHCAECPSSVKAAFELLEKREKTERRRYGSRNFFFQRVWARLNGKDPVDNIKMDSSTRSEKMESRDSAGGCANGDEVLPDDDDDDDGEDPFLTVEPLIDETILVKAEDRGMVSDAHYMAFAQLKPCRVTDEDRCGWYKTRPIGFPGVCCAHCGGRPSSGRYFPQPGDFFLRSSKQSMIRHITDNCPSCPDEIRAALIKLQKRDLKRSGWKIVDDSVLGAGKLFYERLWKRLYTFFGVTVLESRTVEDSDLDNLAQDDNYEEQYGSNHSPVNNHFYSPAPPRRRSISSGSPSSPKHRNHKKRALEVQMPVSSSYDGYGRERGSSNNGDGGEETTSAAAARTGHPERSVVATSSTALLNIKNSRRKMIRDAVIRR